MNRRSVISELAKTLQISETEAEQILRAFAQVLGPIAAEVPPYFERYFEAQIQLVLQRMEDFQHTTQQQIANLQQRIEDFQHTTQQQIANLQQSYSAARFSAFAAFNATAIANLQQRMQQLTHDTAADL
jgi:hypothetical protein